MGVCSKAVRWESILKKEVYMYRICRSGEGIQCSFEINFVGELALAGSARSRDQDGRGDV